MKTKIKNGAIVLLIVLAATACWWLLKPSLNVVVSPIAVPPVPKTVRPPPSEPKSEIVQPLARTPYLGLKDPRWIERRRLREEDPTHDWKTPIVFYGKVIDEKNQPVAGADVEIAWSGTVEKYGGDGVEHKKLTSNAEGLFVIDGIEGKGMTVDVSKKGYYKRKSWNNNRFEYAGFWHKEFIEPDRNKPVVFQLVKRPVAELTYNVGGRIFLQPPALETHLDLIGETVQSTSPADISVRFTRPAGASYEKPFDWSVTIEGSNGAEIAETTDEFMLQAPADGYKSQLVRDYKNPTGNARQKVRFYVRSKARKFYAAVDFEMAAYRRMNGSEPASINITAVVNPNDSPNLEYDPNKDIREIEKAKNP